MTWSAEKKREYNRAWRAANPDKVKAQRRAYAEKNRDRVRAHARKRQRTAMGILNATCEVRSGECEGCRRTFDRLYVDHWHDGPLKGHVRGWLCNSCNRGLGMFGDDPARLDAIRAYMGRAVAKVLDQPAAAE